jgi:DNA-binding XRE family transcriptional regulator
MLSTARAARLTGPELRERRREAELTQAQIAAGWGVNRQRVATVEALAAPTPRAVRQYLEALARVEADR